MSPGALVGGEMACRVCGLAQDEPIWGPDGRSPTYGICSCCGCEFGYEDCLPEAIQRHREQWVAHGAAWFQAAKRPAGWTEQAQLALVPRFYFRVLPGLSGTGPPPSRFGLTESSPHSEGFVVEFTCADGGSWVGNFQLGLGGASGVMAVPGRNRALVLAGGSAYVLEPTSRVLVSAFGGQITLAIRVPSRDAVILGNDLWLECIGPEGSRWRSRRISWDGIAETTIEGHVLRGLAFNPLDDTWSPFEVNVDTGEVSGGSYPPATAVRR